MEGIFVMGEILDWMIFCFGFIVYVGLDGFVWFEYFFIFLLINKK